MQNKARFFAVPAVTAALALAALGIAAPTAAAAADIGARDYVYSPATGSPSGTKPESKLWFNRGWWAILFSPKVGDYHIFKLTSGETWSDTGVAADTRNTSRADTLWDPATSKLYVASHVMTTKASTTTPANAARLYRYSYDATSDRYSLDAGFPVTINAARVETLVIDKDSTGTLWATWTQGSRVYVAHTTGGNDAAWGAPYIVPGNGTTLTSDDISSLIHFGGNRIGVMWSNQTDHNFYFSVHQDGASDASWSTAVVPTGVRSDDHINLKTDAAGNVYAAVKSGSTAKTSALILLLVRSPSGTWSTATFGAVADSHTRPIVLLDQQHGLIHMFATCPQRPKTSGQSGGDICEKTAPMLNPAFAPGIGTPVISEAGSPDMNDVTSTKQNVDGGTGLVVLANNATTNTYWHADESLGAPPAAPIAPPPAAPAPQPRQGGAPAPSKTKLHLAAHPRRVRVGRRIRLTFTVTTLGQSKKIVRGAKVTFAGHHVHTGKKGRAQLVLRFKHVGHRHAVATKAGMQRATAVVLVTHRTP
jgi:hypothetical protein